MGGWSVLLVLIIVSVLTLAGNSVVSRKWPSLDPAEKLGVGGLLALGVSGLIGLLLGVVPHGLNWGLAVLLGAATVVFAVNRKAGLPRIGEWKTHTIALVVSAVLAIPVVIGVLAPPSMLDWDSLAYHLAVPKLWLEQGRIGFVPGIHHSNFPFTAEMLYVWGLQLGHETGAKAFNLCWFLLGGITLFGLARRWYGGKGSTGWWASLAFAGCPVVMWEAGTAYIDIPHGLFCGLAVLYAADALSEDSQRLWSLSGLCLGFAMGTKHTGLQTLGAILIVALVCQFLSLRRRSTEPGSKPSVRGLALALILAVLVASPWYVKSVAYTGNPVYPFFYKQLGGKFWNEWRTQIYTQEQKSFGVGSSPIALGHAVLGLAYQPGRYVNPGQKEGKGFPTGAIGFAALLSGALWCASGRLKAKEKVVLAAVGVSLLAWFVLSQQSRYLVSIVVPLAVLTAGAIRNLKLGSIAVAAVGLQAAYTWWMTWKMQSTDQLPVVTGHVSRDDYLATHVPFYDPAQVINRLVGNVKVALYDEVFGYFLNKPYMWANPGHSTLIPYESCETGSQYADAMESLGFTHAYVNFQLIDPAFRERWVSAMGPRPYSESERQAMRQDPNLWWRYLFAEAVRSGRLKPVAAFPEGSSQPRSALFEFAR